MNELCGHDVPVPILRLHISVVRYLGEELWGHSSRAVSAQHLQTECTPALVCEFRSLPVLTNACYCLTVLKESVTVSLVILFASPW